MTTHVAPGNATTFVELDDRVVDLVRRTDAHVHSELCTETESLWCVDLGTLDRSGPVDFVMTSRIGEQIKNRPWWRGHDSLDTHDF